MACRIIFFLVLSFPAFSQPLVDDIRRSLRNAIQKGQPDTISYYLALLSSQFIEAPHYDSARFYLRRAIAFNTSYGNIPRLAENYNNMGVCHYYLGHTDSSIHFYDAAYKTYQGLRDTAMMSVLNINLGTLYQQKGVYEKGLKCLLEAARHLEKSDPSDNLAMCYNTIGSLYHDVDETESALNFHYRALDVWTLRGNKRSMAFSYNNIGSVYLTRNHLDSALMNFRKSLKIKREINDASGEGISLNNIGEVLIKKGHLREAEKMLKQALAIRIQTKQKKGQVSSRTNLAEIYIRQGNYAAAEHELVLSEEMATSLALLVSLKDIYELQVQLNQKRGYLVKALDYSRKLLVVKDSLLNQDKAKSVAEMQTRYESLKKEDRIALLEKEGLLQIVELERRQTLILSMALAMILILIIVVLIYYNLRTVRKNKVHIELLLKELHHRVKNNLQILSSLLSLQSQQLTDDHAIKAVKSSESRINAMALIHRKLYTVDQNRTIDIKEYITELIQYLVYSYGYHEKNFKLDLEITEINIDVDKAIPLGLILNELISNAFKHAYQNQPNPSLIINLAYPDAHELDICIRDNGAGMQAVDGKQRKTFGMKIVSTLIKELKGNLDVKSDNGTTYHLQIPI